MSTFSTVCNIASVVTKSFFVVEAGVTTYRIASKPGALTATEKAAIAANVVFGLAQALDATTAGLHAGGVRLPNGMRLGTSASAGALDITRVTLVKCSRNKAWDANDTLDLVGISLYRAADVGSTYLQSQPDAGKSPAIQKLEMATQALSTGAQSISARHQIKYVSNLIWDHTGRRWILNPEAAQNAQPTPASEKDAAAQASDIQGDQEMRASIDAEIEAIKDWENLQEIPSSIAERFPTCKFTNKPIRFMMQPSFLHRDRTFVFSKEGVEQALEKGTPPEWWPSEKPFRRESFMEATAFTQYESIDLKLEMLANLYKTLQLKE